MKTLILLFVALVGFCATPVQAQQADSTPYRIVFQLASGDTLVHQALMRQINNMLSVEPTAQLEVVCHGPGLNMLRNESVVAEKVRINVARGVVFNGCEFTMKEKNISRDMLLPEAKTVRAGILHIVKRQSEGWFYIKAGF
jgi:intracellular sulfur oxidation DsrE/DsrF family protein